jgi:cell division protein FtsI (penicillin-binding protein 3)
VADTGGYAGNRHQSMFIGMMPAERPRLVGLVMIDEPAAQGYYGGLVAAPVFSRVLQGAARLLLISPDGTREPELGPPATTRTVAFPSAATPERPRT